MSAAGVSEGNDQQQPRGSRGPGQVAKQKQRGAVGPVGVLEHQHDRSPGADVHQQIGDGMVQPQSLGVLVGGDRRGQTADALGQAGNQPGQLAPARRPGRRRSSCASAVRTNCSSASAIG